MSGYPFTKYGLPEGRVVTLSADSARLSAASGSGAALIGSSAGVAGMQVQAEIRQGERTVMEYLLSPVRRVVSEAGGER